MLLKLTFEQIIRFYRDTSDISEQKYFCGIMTKEQNQWYHLLTPNQTKPVTCVEGLHPRVRCQNISSVEYNNCKICAIYTFTISCCDRQKMYAHSHYIAQSTKTRGLIDFIFVKLPNQSKGQNDDIICISNVQQVTHISQKNVWRPQSLSIIIEFHVILSITIQD